jgi:hypothetical protein
VRQTLRRLPDLSKEQAETALERTVQVIIARIEHESVATSEHEDFLRALLHAVDAR